MIYSVAQDLPMGDGAKIHKNYYVNMGEQQGLKDGSELSVYRILNRSNSFATDKAVTFKVKIGELKVIHAEEENSITIMKKYNNDANLYVEIPSLNIGDIVTVKTED